MAAERGKTKMKTIESIMKNCPCYKSYEKITIFDEEKLELS